MTKFNKNDKIVRYDLNPIIEAEKRFQDTKIVNNYIRRRESYFWTLAKDIREKFNKLVCKAIKNKSVLVLGCGQENDLKYIKEGAQKLTLIDISLGSIETQRKIIFKMHLQDKVQAYIMDANNLKFNNESFDLVIGIAVLHHLDLKLALSETKRVLRPSGEMIFLEPLGINPIINLYRKLTPSARTRFEHPFTKKDLILIKKIFPYSKIDFYYLTTLLALPFTIIKLDFFAKLLWKMLFKFDQLLLNFFPFFKILCWQCIIYGRKTK